MRRLGKILAAFGVGMIVVAIVNLASGLLGFDLNSALFVSGWLGGHTFWAVFPRTVRA